MKKYSIIKRLAAGTISAMMVFTSLSAAFAENTAATVTADEVTLLDELTYSDDAFKSKGYFDLTNTNVYFNYNNGEIVQKSANGGIDLLTIPQEKLNTLKSDYDKYIASFDVKVLDTHSTSNSRVRYRGYNNSNADETFVGAFGITKDTILSAKVNNYVGSTETKINTVGKWTNLKMVSYIEKDGQTALDRVEFYINNTLYAVLNNPSTTGIFQDIFLQNDDQQDFDDVVYRNFKLEGVKSKSVSKADVVTKTTNFGMLNMNQSLYKDGVYNNSASAVLSNMPAGIVDLYNEYSINFDVKVDATTTDGTKLQRCPIISTKVEGSLSYIGLFDIYDNKLNFQAGAGGEAFEKDIEKNKWSNVEIVIVRNGKSFSLTYYVDGVKIGNHKSNPNNQYHSWNGIFTNMQLENPLVANSVKFKNFTLKGLETVKDNSNAFNASIEKSGNDLKLTFNKEVVKDSTLLNKIVVKNAKDVALSVTGVVGEDNKTVTFKNIADSDWYKVEIPERFVSADGYIIQNTVVSMPHFEVTKAEITDGETTKNLQTSFANTTNEDKEVVVMLAAYNQDNNTLKQVSVKKYTVNKNETLTATDLPSVDATEDTTYKGYIWTSNYTPVSGIVTAE